MLSVDYTMVRRVHLGLLCVAATSASAAAQPVTVLKDHITNTALWNNIGGFADFDFSGSNNTDTVGAACFAGNGGVLTGISGIFYKDNATGPNGGSWNAFSFRFIFYNSVAAFQSSPFVGSSSHSFARPGNANWLTPVGSWGAFDLFRFDFDLSGLGVTTTPGALQLAAIQTAGDGFSGGVGFMSFSTGGSGAIGTEPDWYRNNSMSWGPATFQSLNAPHGFAAVRITAAQPPCPADMGRAGGVPGADGVLDNNDFIVFIDAFFAGSPAADFGATGGVPGPDGHFDNNDFIVFIDRFFAGCG